MQIVVQSMKVFAESFRDEISVAYVVGLGAEIELLWCDLVGCLRRELLEHAALYVQVIENVALDKETWGIGIVQLA